MVTIEGGETSQEFEFQVEELSMSQYKSTHYQYGELSKKVGAPKP